MLKTEDVFTLTRERDLAITALEQALMYTIKAHLF